jgi:hypothetical protein
MLAKLEAKPWSMASCAMLFLSRLAPAWQGRRPPHRSARDLLVKVPGTPIARPKIEDKTWDRGTAVMSQVGMAPSALHGGHH